MSELRRIRLLRSTLVAIGATTALLATPPPANAQVDQTGRLGHFRCYQTEGPPANEVALLRDQFDADQRPFSAAMVRRPFRLCNAAEKTDEAGQVSPILDRTHHLVLYRLFDFSPDRDREFLIRNQFGEQKIRTLRYGAFLAVPTDKNQEGFPKGLDHFKCYIAVGDPVQRLVKTVDQFQEEPEVKVAQPYLFCNPTMKFHAGALTRIENPEEHLACYMTSRTPFEEVVSIKNQFQAGRLIVGAADTLCVPSRKGPVVNPGLPDLTIKLTAPARVMCPTGGGSCTEEMDFEVRELAGVAVAASFDVNIVNELGQNATMSIPGIAANGVFAGTLTLGPPGGNCYNPDCLTRGVVDPSNAIGESDETNNTDTRDDLG